MTAEIAGTTMAIMAGQWAAHQVVVAEEVQYLLSRS